LEEFKGLVRFSNFAEAKSESLRRNQNWERSDQPYIQDPKHLKKSAVSNEDYQH